MPALASMFSRLCLASPLVSFALLAARPARAQSANTSFSVTSTASAMAPISAGSTAPTIIARRWRRPRAPAPRPGAPISRPRPPTAPAVNARDRIGKGPWQNAKGVVVAKDVAELHGANNISPSRPR